MLITIEGGETYYLRTVWTFKKGEIVEVVERTKGRAELSTMKPLDVELVRDRSLFHPDQSTNP